MSSLRLPYQTLSPEAYRGFGLAKQALDKTPLGKPLVELVYLRVSQINGCAFCLEMHAAALRAGGMPQAKLDALAGWRVSAHFNERERLAWPGPKPWWTWRAAMRRMRTFCRSRLFSAMPKSPTSASRSR
ncbi:carboxymuconolactone decarboxylase family protein [Luteimonas sp. gir]|uniref:carboxymuconolactone decarboxylase family protein n=1 Tax=Luteimonas sp. gir TaxID=3127960 RepID=UPI003075E21F